LITAVLSNAVTEVLKSVHNERDVWFHHIAVSSANKP